MIDWVLIGWNMDYYIPIISPAIAVAERPDKVRVKVSSASNALSPFNTTVICLVISNGLKVTVPYYYY